VGKDTDARYHIDILDLNNPALVHARKERSVFRSMLRGPLKLHRNKSVSDPQLAAVMGQIREILDYKIPEIPAP